MICHLSAHKQTILFPRFIFLTTAPHNTCLHISIPPGSRIILPDHQRPVHSSTPPNLQRVATVPRLGRSGQKELEAYLRLEFQVSFFFFFYCSTNVFSIRLHVRELWRRRRMSSSTTTAPWKTRPPPSPPSSASSSPPWTGARDATRLEQVL